MNNLTPYANDFTFTPQQTITSVNGDTYADFLPLFNAIEAYVHDLGANTKWVGESLTIYHKDFNKLNRERITGPVYTTLIEFTQKGFDEDAETTVYLSDDVEDYTEDDIEDFNGLAEVIKNFVTSELPAEFYYTKEENEVREAKQVLAKVDSQKRQQKQKLFEAKLIELRISRSEFEEALSLYQ